MICSTIRERLDISPGEPTDVDVYELRLQGRNGNIVTLIAFRAHSDANENDILTELSHAQP